MRVRAQRDSHGPHGPAAAGERIERYEILSELGRGGMGFVYTARDTRLGRRVALKCPRTDTAHAPDLQRHLLAEARAAARVSHPHIVSIYEVFEHDGLLWQAMELVEGVTLRDRLHNRKPLPVDEVLQHAEGLADALRAAHERHLLHRDIKPSNVLLGADGRARITDFGVAVRLVPPDDGDPSLSVATETLATSPHFVGTPGYVSPEQALARPVDARSDLFSFGAVLYEMCTGRPAFADSEDAAWIDAVLHREPEPIARLDPEVPEELERIVRKALAKLPDERHQSAAEMLADLRALRRRRDAALVTPVPQPVAPAHQRAANHSHCR
jgi:serine/threonine protein kinase